MGEKQIIRLMDIPYEVAQIMDGVTQIVWASDPEGRVIYYNRRWWEYTGLSPEAYDDNLPIEFIHPDDRESVRKTFEMGLRSNVVFEHQYRLKNHLGNYRWHLCRVTPLCDRNGAIFRWVGTATDIQEQRIVEHAKIEAERKFRAFFEQSSLPIQIYSVEGFCREANRAWEVLFDSSIKELDGYNVLEDPQAIAIGVTTLLKKAMSGEVVEVPSKYYDPKISGKRGRPRWLDSVFFPIRDHEGTVIEVAIIFRDVTDREQAFEDLRHANENLAHAVEARQELLDICGHELKTPLSSLKLQTQYMKRRLMKGDKSVFVPVAMEKLLDVYGNQINRLAHLVDDMLDLTRISGGKLALYPEKIELTTLVRESIERFTDQADTLSPSVRTHFHFDATGFWDPFRIEQVLTNLLSNALKYGKGSPIDVSIVGSDDGSAVHLSVRDQGMGIARENQERIFQRFERAISANEVSGLGLGLYITRQIVILHGGTISVESELGRGACFTVILPLNSEV